MIFVPTKEGISHNPQEYCGPEDWLALSTSNSDMFTNHISAIGTQVLLGAIFRYDALRVARGDFEKA
jgi:hypothetical protein